jgi:hypothetical protein
LSDYSPMQTSDTKVRLSCAPGGPHCTELNQPRCAMCHSFCKEPGGPTNQCFCHQEAEAEARPKYIPLGDETVYHLGTVYPHPGGSTPRPHISCLVAKEANLPEEEDSSNKDDYDHPDPFPVPTVGSTAAMPAEVGRGRTASHQKPGQGTGHASSPTPPGFVLNIHPNYIPLN